jgi:hypothetical protein
MSTSYGDETVIIPAANGAAPTPPAPGDPLFGMTPSQEAQYTLDLGLGPDHLKGDARAEYDRLAKLREYRAQHPEASPAVPKPVQAGDDPLSGVDPAIANKAVPPPDPAIEQQAAYAIDYGTPKESLPPDIAAAVDRLLAERYRERKYAAAQAARNGDGRPADYLAGLDPAIVQQAAYAIDYETDPATLSPDVQAACRALRAVGYPRAQPPAAGPAQPAGPRPGDAEEAARYARFKVAEAARAEWDQAMRGNGSDSAFVRWLTRKPLPINMTTNRVVCGLLWAFWTVVCLIYMVAGGGAGAAFTGFIFAVLCGFYDWRIWTKRATRLAYFIVF